MSEAFEATRRHLFTAGEWAAFSELYSGIRETSFSQHVLSVQSDRLAVVRAVGLGWSDLGEPGRVRSALEDMMFERSAGCSQTDARPLPIR
jgi:hypothetical protein